MWGSVHAPFKLSRFLLRVLCAEADHGFSSGYDGQVKAAQGHSEPDGAARFLRLREVAMRTSRLAAHRAKLLLIDCCKAEVTTVDDEAEPRPEMLCLRGQTLALIRHFFEISSQVGRVSSLLGREFFRSRVSHHAIPSFEEQAVFVRDVELCLAKLNCRRTEVLTLLGLYDYSYDEVSQMLQCSRTRVREWFNEALDTLSEVFLNAGLLRENNPDRRQRQVMRGKQPAEAVYLRRKPPGSVRVVPAVQAPEPRPEEGIPRRRSRLA
jgi:sigma-70-like protein